jgi:hypothetical protein
MRKGDRIKCHGNLNRGCLSVVPKGAKTELYYDTAVVLIDAEFKCSAAGHKRIVDRKCRSVVADVHGTVEAVLDVDGDIYAYAAYWYGRLQPVSYNPIQYPDRPYFYTLDGQPVGKVARAYIVTSSTIDTKAKTKAYIERTD